MKLYELKQHQKFKHNNVDDVVNNEVFTFEKVDGMYARIYNEQGQLGFVACYVDVEIVE